MTIAIIDDDEGVRESLQDLLRSCGYATEIFASAEEFLACPRHGWDCVLSDVSMPGMDGVELAEALASRSSSPPVLLMSAHASPRMRRDARDLSVDLLQKPFKPETLLECVRDIVIGRRGAAA